MNDGGYWAHVVDGVCGLSGKKNPQMVIKIMVTHVAADGKWVDLERPEERRMYWSMTDGAIQYSSERLDRLGFNGVFSVPGFSEASMNEGFEVKCFHETYQGKSIEKWDLPSEGGEVEKAPDDTLRLLSAKWKGTHGKKPTGTPPVPPKPKQDSDDSIPF